MFLELNSSCLIKDVIILDTGNKSNAFVWWALRLCFHVKAEMSIGLSELRRVDENALYTHSSSVQTGSSILRWSAFHFCSWVGGQKCRVSRTERDPAPPYTLISTCTKIKIHTPLPALLTLLSFYPECSKSHLGVALLPPRQLQPLRFLTLHFSFLSLSFSLIRVIQLRSPCSLSTLTPSFSNGC